MPVDKEKIVVFWFRRDLRLEDNSALGQALLSGFPVLPIFIFDQNILEYLPADDARVSFIYSQLYSINNQLKKIGSSIKVLHGKPEEVLEKLIGEYDIQSVYSNKDYEPYAIHRDKEITALLESKGKPFKLFKDQVIFEENDILKNDGKPYTVFTPYKRKWLAQFELDFKKEKGTKISDRFYKSKFTFPTLKSIGFQESEIKVKDFSLAKLSSYPAKRNIPSEDFGSYLSPHLRFGTVSIRQVIRQLDIKDEVFLSELVWREFFMQIIFHFPHVVQNNFNPKYDGIRWRNNEEEFQKWCAGKTGYPLVDAGMRELNKTGYMHNRVRMVVASFLCKHLLIDWRWGEAYFAQKLLDFELSSNNGNWQWAAGTGCDAAPYFRIFNPHEQLRKFDKQLKYVKKWVPEYGTGSYPAEMVDHKTARQRALNAYKVGLLNPSLP